MIEIGTQIRNGFYCCRLLEYIEDVMNATYVSMETRKNWAFGAIEFAYYSKLITFNDKDRFCKTFELLGE